MICLIIDNIGTLINIFTNAEIRHVNQIIQFWCDFRRTLEFFRLELFSWHQAIAVSFWLWFSNLANFPDAFKDPNEVRYLQIMYPSNNIKCIGVKKHRRIIPRYSLPITLHTVLHLLQLVWNFWYWRYMNMERCA